MPTLSKTRSDFEIIFNQYRALIDPEDLERIDKALKDAAIVHREITFRTKGAIGAFPTTPVVLTSDTMNMLFDPGTIESIVKVLPPTEPRATLHVFTGIPRIDDESVNLAFTLGEKYFVYSAQPGTIPKAIRDAARKNIEITFKIDSSELGVNEDHQFIEKIEPTDVPNEFRIQYLGS